MTNRVNSVGVLSDTSYLWRWIDGLWRGLRFVGFPLCGRRAQWVVETSAITKFAGLVNDNNVFTALCSQYRTSTHPPRYDSITTKGAFLTHILYTGLYLAGAIMC